MLTIIANRVKVVQSAVLHVTVPGPYYVICDDMCGIIWYLLKVVGPYRMTEFCKRFILLNTDNFNEDVSRHW